MFETMIGDAALERLYQRLRARDPLDLSLSMATSLGGDMDLNPGFGGDNRADARAASVLMPLVDRAEGISVLLTQRTDHLPDHAGQISFPGGSRETHDADDIETALRETEEEVGIDRAYVDVIGKLDLYQTGTGFDVTPVVGVVSSEFTLKIDEREVAEAFEVPLAFVLDPANRETHTREFRGNKFTYFAITHDGHYIWGATAAMLVNLSNTLIIHAGQDQQ